MYTVIVAANFNQIIQHYKDEDSPEFSLRLMAACLLIPMILLSYIPNLKYLAPVSMVANIFMGTGLGITFYYLVWDLPPINSVPLFASIEDFPRFFSITIFAMEAIGTVYWTLIFGIYIKELELCYRCRNATGEQHENTAAFCWNLRCSQQGNVRGYAYIHFTRILRIREISGSYFGQYHVKFTNGRNVGVTINAIHTWKIYLY